MNTSFSVQPKALVGAELYIFISTLVVLISASPMFSSECGGSGCCQVGVFNFGISKLCREFHQDVSKMVAPNAIAPTLDKDHARPAMSVDGSRRPGRDASMQYTHLFVLKQECVVAGSGDHGIQRLRPWPRQLRCARRLRHLSSLCPASRTNTPGLKRTDPRAPHVGRRPSV